MLPGDAKTSMAKLTNLLQFAGITIWFSHIEEFFMGHFFALTLIFSFIYGTPKAFAADAPTDLCVGLTFDLLKEKIKESENFLTCNKAPGLCWAIYPQFAKVIEADSKTLNSLLAKIDGLNVYLTLSGRQVVSDLEKADLIRTFANDLLVLKAQIEGHIRGDVDLDNNAIANNYKAAVDALQKKWTSKDAEINARIAKQKNIREALIKGKEQLAATLTETFSNATGYAKIEGGGFKDAWKVSYQGYEYSPALNPNNVLYKSTDFAKRISALSVKLVALAESSILEIGPIQTIWEQLIKLSNDALSKGGGSQDLRLKGRSISAILDTSYSGSRYYRRNEKAEQALDSTFDPNLKLNADADLQSRLTAITTILEGFEKRAARAATPN